MPAGQLVADAVHGAEMVELGAVIAELRAHVQDQLACRARSFGAMRSIVPRLFLDWCSIVPLFFL
jgi:aromatic ring-opening dioxygenase LigB subunit